MATGLIFAAIIAVIAVAYFFGKISSVLAFWLAYILTRPVGASLGDLFSQPPKYGGLGFGTTVTSFIFLAGIAALVVYITFTRRGEEGADVGSDVGFAPSIPIAAGIAKGPPGSRDVGSSVLSRTRMKMLAALMILFAGWCLLVMFFGDFILYIRADDPG